MGPIKENHRKMLLCGIVLTSLAFLGFIMASLFACVYYMNDPVKIEKDEDAAQKERLDKITKH